MSVSRILSANPLLPRSVKGGTRTAVNGNGNPDESRRYGISNQSESPKSESGSASELSKPETTPSSESTTFRKSTMAVKAQNGDLIACAGVKLKGTISSCNTLTVEGEVDASVQSRRLVVLDDGMFVGKAQVDEADIGGRFEGTLHAIGKLTVRRSGRVNGHITYGQIEVEPGGELRGNVSLQGGNRKSTIFPLPRRVRL